MKLFSTDPELVSREDADLSLGYYVSFLIAIQIEMLLCDCYRTSWSDWP